MKARLRKKKAKQTRQFYQRVTFEVLRVLQNNLIITPERHNIRWQKDGMIMVTPKPR